MDGMRVCKALDGRGASRFPSTGRSFRRPSGRGGLAGIADAGRVDTYQMIRPRTAEAGFKSSSDAMFRATGITAYLKNGGMLEHAQQRANHASPRTMRDRCAAKLRIMK